ncbi:MAG: transcriptional repressor [Actinomycetota bacterium]|nr:transcriptional repressor [Actinomycetota bacterium]
MTVAPRHPPLPVGNLEDAARVVRDAGGRLTAPRRAVLEALLTADGPVSAEQIADGLGGRLATTEAVSVYRNLDWLEEIGVVRHVHLGHGAGLYQLAGAGEHAYLVCERCAGVTRIDSEQLRRVRTEIEKASGFHAHFDHFPIHGLCAACARSTARSDDAA